MPEQARAYRAYRAYRASMTQHSPTLLWPARRGEWSISTLFLLYDLEAMRHARAMLPATIGWLLYQYQISRHTAGTE